MYSGIFYSVSCKTSLDYRLVYKRLVPAKKYIMTNVGCAIIKKNYETLCVPACSKTNPYTSI